MHIWRRGIIKSSIPCGLNGEGAYEAARKERLGNKSFFSVYNNIALSCHEQAGRRAGNGKPAYRGRSDDKIALEFAVSWNAAAMEDILATLKDKNTRATFVVSGKWARENADMLKRIADEGHEIGTMGDDPSFDGNLSETKADIQKSLESIKAASGVDTVLYYSGSRSVAVSARASRALGLTHVLSTIDLRCGYGSKDDIIKRGLNEPIIGSIILLQPTRACADALGGLIDGLNAKGIIAARVGDVLGGMV